MDFVQAMAARLSALIWRDRARVQADAARDDGRPDIAECFEWAGLQHPYNAWEAEQMAQGNVVRVKNDLVSRIEAAGFRVWTFQKRPEGSWQWHAVAVTWSVDDHRRGIRWEVSHKSEQRALEVLAQELGV